VAACCEKNANMQKSKKAKKKGCKKNSDKKAKKQKASFCPSRNNSHYCYLLLSEVHLQEVLDFMSGRRSGVPNYKNELLLNIVEAIKHTSHNGW
jgi:hypothetical protein